MNVEVENRGNISVRYQLNFYVLPYSLNAKEELPLFLKFGFGLTVGKETHIFLLLCTSTEYI